MKTVAFVAIMALLVTPAGVGLAQSGRHSKKSSAPESPKPLIPPLRVGATGTLGNGAVDARVVQVLDGSHAIISLFFMGHLERILAIMPTDGIVTDQSYVFTKQGAEVVHPGKEVRRDTLAVFRVTGIRIDGASPAAASQEARETPSDGDGYALPRGGRRGSAGAAETINRFQAEGIRLERLRTANMMFVVEPFDSASPAKPQPPSKPFSLPLRVGSTGTLGDGHYDQWVRVTQVVDKSHALLSVEQHGGALHIDDEATVYAAVPAGGVIEGMYYVFTKNGAETMGYGKQYGSLQMFKVTGTHTYGAGSGPKTVFAVEPCDDEVPAGPPAERASPTKPKPKIKPVAAVRTWTSADGGFTLEAKLVKATPDAVWLEKKDGTTVRVPNEKLSSGDLAYIRSRSP